MCRGSFCISVVPQFEIGDDRETERPSAPRAHFCLGLSILLNDNDNDNGSHIIQMLVIVSFPFSNSFARNFSFKSQAIATTPTYLTSNVSICNWYYGRLLNTTVNYVQLYSEFVRTVRREETRILFLSNSVSGKKLTQSLFCRFSRVSRMFVLFWTFAIHLACKTQKQKNESK